MGSRQLRVFFCWRNTVFTGLGVGSRGLLAVARVSWSKGYRFLGTEGSVGLGVRLPKSQPTGKGLG